MNRRSFVRTIGAAAFGTIVPLRGNALAKESEAASSSVRQPSTAGRVVTLEANPAPISIETARTAMVVVDMQNDFGSQGGSFQRAGIDISMI